MKYLILISVLLLAGCGPSLEERRAAFLNTCQPAFSAAQCAVLFGLNEESRQAKESAEFAAVMSATTSAAASGGRR